MENQPRFMTIREVAKTKILPEHCLRVMAKRGELPSIKAGCKVLINYDKLIDMLNRLGDA